MKFQLEFQQSDYLRVELPGTIEVSQYSWDRVGGPDTLEAQVLGDPLLLDRWMNMLGRTCLCRNKDHELVWWGRLTGLEIMLPACTIVKELTSIINRVKIVYTHLDQNGEAVQAETDWVDHENSQRDYGVIEYIGEVTEVTTSAVALATAQSYLSKYSQPTIRVRGGANSTLGVMLHCKGFMHTTKYRYYENLNGYSAIPAGQGDTIGFAISDASNSYAFDADGHTISNTGAILEAYKTYNRIVITGASNAANIGTWTVDRETSHPEPIVLTASTGVVFVAPDEINRAAGELDIFERNDVIVVTGTSSNNKAFLVDSVTPNQIIVKAATVTNESPATTTITQGNGISVDSETLVDELPAAAVTARSLEVALAQPIVAERTWTLHEIVVPCARFGTPSDSMKVSIWSSYTSSTGDHPSASLGYGTVLWSDMATTTEFVSFILGTPVNIVAGTKYWIVIERTGSAALTHGYTASFELVEDSPTLTMDHAMNIWTGSAWELMTPRMAIGVQLWGWETLPNQVKAMLETQTDFISSVQLDPNMDADLSRQYRARTKSVYDEVYELLNYRAATQDKLLELQVRETNIATLSRLQNVDDFADPKPQLTLQGTISFGQEIVSLKGVSMTGFAIGTKLLHVAFPALDVPTTLVAERYEFTVLGTMAVVKFFGEEFEGFVVTL